SVAQVSAVWGLVIPLLLLLVGALGGVWVALGSKRVHVLRASDGAPGRQASTEARAGIDSAQHAVALDPANADVWITLRTALSEAARYEEAIAAYRRATELDPADAVAWTNLGTTLTILKRYEEAIAAYRQATAFDASLAPAWNNLGAALAVSKSFDEALTTYQ